MLYKHAAHHHGDDEAPKLHKQVEAVRATPAAATTDLKSIARLS